MGRVTRAGSSRGIGLDRKLELLEPRLRIAHDSYLGIALGIRMAIIDSLGASGASMDV